jgi:hypothetical protein
MCFIISGGYGYNIKLIKREKMENYIKNSEQLKTKSEKSKKEEGRLKKEEGRF